MQSSTAIAIRALVMLIVLISVPLFAIFGKNVPEVVKGLLDGRGLVLTPAPGSGPNQTGATPLTASNSFGQPAPYRAGPGTAGSAGAGVSAAASTPNLLNSAAAPGMNVPRGEVARNDLPRNPASAPAALSDWQNSTAQPVGVQPTVYQTPADGKGSAATAAPPQFRSDIAQTSPYSGTLPQKNVGTPAAPEASASDEKFRQAEIKLRELGATHYMLETWGPDNNRYRFVCQMAMGGNAGVNRYFQAIEDDPWMAMNTVLRQVEQWRTQPMQ